VEIIELIVSFLSLIREFHKLFRVGSLLYSGVMKKMVLRATSRYKVRSAHPTTCEF